ncbi:hypothetical protein [Streptomyces sp. A0592]|uniref:hypothetical protein n=1 Tax=Streptomyces sp. A0592 TaxID=2563099 RepID=UPI00109EBF26|nr:hypothetical protein [Streptomyces sp. A0592]THA86758.1 hypothetical protein E6U81_01325 [Streptomyces sp. A0592]
MSEYRLLFSASLVTAGCLLLSACAGTPAPGSADRSADGTRTSAAPAPSKPAPTAALPAPGAAGGVPDTARLMELALQPGETAGVAEDGGSIYSLTAGEVRPLPPADLSVPCTAMWGLLRQRGAHAAISQTFDSEEPGSPTVGGLASYAGTDAATVFGRLRTALAGCPSVEEDGRTVTIRYEDLDTAGFPEDTLRIRMTMTDAGSTGPAEVIDRIVARVGVCITDLSAAGVEPYPRVSETPVLRQVDRLRAAQGL